MTIEKFFTDASSIFTVVSFVTFISIMLWAYSSRRKADFEAAANLPFADDDEPSTTRAAENSHG